MIVRVLIVAVALAVGVLGVTRHHDATTCASALRDAQRAAADPGRAAGALRAHCRGGDELASGAAALVARGHPGLARALAVAATRREPENARAWLGLAFALRRTDPEGARRAQARATALNPYAARVAP